MKKLATILILFLAFNGYCQISINEDFEDPDYYENIPTDWITDDGWGGYFTAIYDEYSCSGSQGFYINLYNYNDFSIIETANYSGTLTTPLTVTYNLLILDYENEVAVTYDFGNIELFYSTDDGNSWISLGDVTSANFTATESCQTISYTIPEGTLADGGTIKFKFDMNWRNEDFIITIDDFTVNQSANASISDLNKNNLKLYPNPVKDILNIAYTDAISNVVVFDFTGRKVLESNPNSSNFSVQTNLLSSGTYLIDLQTQKGEKSGVKFIKK